MKKIANKTPFILLLLLVFSLLIAASMPVQAQFLESGSAENKEADKKDNDLMFNLYAETGIEYTDNVFRLTESQILKMKTDAIEDALSGRFKDMDSISDYIVYPEVGFSLDSNSALGGKFSLLSWLRYNYFTKNQKGSFTEGRIRLKNSIGEKGALTLEGNFVFDFFKKNYLSGVNDANENGNITRIERVYSSAVYNEYEANIAYKHEIIDNKDGRISGMAIQPFAGYGIRRYNSTFGNRDQDINILGLELNLAFKSRIDLEMIYKYEGVSSPGNRELILFDETASSADVNSDGEIRRNAPVTTDIDRSSTRYTIEINPSFKLTKDARIYLGYERRITAFDSSNQLDVDHYDQESCRRQISSGIKYIFSKAWSAAAEYRRTDEDEEEDGDYSENSYLFKIKYDFN